MPTKAIARREFLKRNLALTAYAASGFSDATPFSQAANSQPQYTGPTSGVSVNDLQLDSLQFSRSLHDNNKPSMSFTATSEVSARSWQRLVRRKLTELL